MNHPSQTIAIVIDNPVRDLPSCCLLAKQLVDLGYEVDLVPMYGGGAFLFERHYDLVLLNYARKNNKQMLVRLARAGSLIAILDTEGGVFGSYKEKDSNDYLQTVIEDERIRDLIKEYFVWGEGLYKMLQDRKVYKPEQLQLTGTPRSDFYSTPWDQLFRLPGNFESQFASGFVLITSSFPMVNPAFQTVEAEKKMMIETFHYSEAFIENLFKRLKNAQQMYIESALFLAQQFPQIPFVYRPHPFEDLKIYQKAFANQKNLFLIKEGVIGQWLSKCLCLIHFESSTSFEARFAGKPAFGYAGFQDIWDMPEIQSMTEYVETPEQMKAQIEKVIAGNYQILPKISEAIKTIEKQVYFRVDGKSYLRVADRIKTFQAVPRSWSHVVKGSLYFTHQLIRMLGKRLLKWNPETMKAKSFRLKEVSEIMQGLQRISASGSSEKAYDIQPRGILRYLGFTPVVSISRYSEHH
ncbi:MAG: surface carbohydrate biosynthesis protein [Pseudobdellovibrionaceae bacterium]